MLDTMSNPTEIIAGNLRGRLRRLWTADWRAIETMERSGIRIGLRRCLMLVLVADGFTQAEVARAFAVSRAAIAKDIAQARRACAAAPEIIPHITEAGWQALDNPQGQLDPHGRASELLMRTGAGCFGRGSDLTRTDDER